MADRLAAADHNFHVTPVVTDEAYDYSKGGKGAPLPDHHRQGRPPLTALQHQFSDLEQQQDASTFGMWVFIAQEILFFGGLFTVYAIYRHAYPGAFAAGSHHLSWQIGFANTLVLIASSLTMAMAVYSAALGQRRRIVGFLLATVLLGVRLPRRQVPGVRARRSPLPRRRAVRGLPRPGRPLRRRGAAPRGRRGAARADSSSRSTSP